MNDEPKLSAQTLAEMAAGRAQLLGKNAQPRTSEPALPVEVTPEPPVKRGPGRPRKVVTDG